MICLKPASSYGGLNDLSLCCPLAHRSWASAGQRPPRCGFSRAFGGVIIAKLLGTSWYDYSTMLMKNLQPQTGPGQNIFSQFLSFWLSLHSSFFWSFTLSSSFFYHFRYHFFKSFFNHVLIMFWTFFNHFFLSCFIIFSSSGAKIFQKMENYNFPRVFSLFYHFFHFFIFFIIFHHFASIPPLEAKMIKKNDKKMKKNSRKIAIFHFLETCNFPRVFFLFFFIFLSFFYHFSSFFLSFFINSTTGSKNDKKKL